MSYTRPSYLDEATWVAINQGIVRGASYVVEGMQISDSGGLFVDVAAGEALVVGYHIVQASAETNIAVAVTDTSYIWLNPDGTYESETSGTPTDSDALLLGLVTANGTGVTGITYQRNVVSERCIYVMKVADEAITGGLQDDDEFVIATSAGDVWDITLLLRIEQIGTGADFQCEFSGCDGAVYALGAAAPSGSISGEFNSDPTAQWTLADMDTIDDDIPMVLRAVLFASGSSIVFRWGQGSTTGNNTVLQYGSTMIARRLT